MVEVFFDGSCGPKNPGGKAGYGVVAFSEGEIIAELCGFVGEGEGMTNNVAEYHGFLCALKWCIAEGHEGVRIKGDSNLVVQMVNKNWGWKKGRYLPHPDKPHLRELLEEAHQLIGNRFFLIEWIPREKNAIADDLANYAIGKPLELEHKFV